VEVGEAEAFSVELVGIWSFEDWVAVAGHVAEALVVGEEDEDVGAAALLREGAGGGGESCGVEKVAAGGRRHRGL
jgi:hypothetical protein